MVCWWKWTQRQDWLKRSGFCPNISLEKSKLLLTVKLFFVMGSKCKTKNFAKLLKRVLIANKIGLRIFVKDFFEFSKKICGENPE